MNRRYSHALFIVLLMTVCASVKAQVVSFGFADTIKSNGRGLINLLKPADQSRVITAAQLEAFRQNNEGALVFAVDVNEAASGSEKAETQGVAIDSLTLRVTFGSEIVEYTEYATQTQSILLKAGAPARSVYATLLGEAGSNRVSVDAESVINNSSFDATLRVPVDRDLIQASSIILDIRLLQTDTTLGDPEAFYDFSNGFESVALLSAADAAYLDELQAGHAGAPLVLLDDGAPSGLSWLYYPSAQSYFLVSYEDLFPQRGDYDFNDLVVAYQVAVGVGESGAVRRIQGTGFLLARGAAYNHDWHLRIPLPDHASGRASLSLFAPGAETPLPGYPRNVEVAGDIDLTLAESILNIFFDGGSTYVNTFAEQAVVPGPRFEFAVDLDSPIARNAIGAAPFDPYIYVYETGYEVHLVDQKPVLSYSSNSANGHTEFRDAQGFPFAMLFPDDWQPPLAAIDIGLAYPNFLDFIQSRGATAMDWYRQPQAERIKQIGFKQW